MRRRVVCLQPHFAFASFCVLPLPEGVIRVCRTALYKGCAGAGENLRGCQPRARRVLSPAPPAGGSVSFAYSIPPHGVSVFGAGVPRYFLIHALFSYFRAAVWCFFPAEGITALLFISALPPSFPRCFLSPLCPRRFRAAFSTPPRRIRGGAERRECRFVRRRRENAVLRSVAENVVLRGWAGITANA